MTRIRFCFDRSEELRYLSHLDMVRMFHRALRRSGLPLAYSRGYNPHLRFNLAAPLPLKATASGEMGEVFFEESIEPAYFLSRFKGQLPQGLLLESAAEVEPGAPPLPALVTAALYRAEPEGPAAADLETGMLAAAVQALLLRDEIMVEGQGKKKRPRDIRPRVINLKVDEAEQGCPQVILHLRAGSSGGASPALLLSLLEAEAGPAWPREVFWKLHREKLFFGLA